MSFDRLMLDVNATLCAAVDPINSPGIYGACSIELNANYGGSFVKNTTESGAVGCCNACQQTEGAGLSTERDSQDCPED